MRKTFIMVCRGVTVRAGRGSIENFLKNLVRREGIESGSVRGYSVEEDFEV